MLFSNVSVRNMLPNLQMSDQRPPRSTSVEYAITKLVPGSWVSCEPK
jgi:hypothetical protein